MTIVVNLNGYNDTYIADCDDSYEINGSRNDDYIVGNYDDDTISG